MEYNTHEKIVLVGGCFDVLHYGHIQFLITAKNHGDRLIVALESDENVKTRKGNNRPIHTQAQRKAMLLALSCVDEVIELPTMDTDQKYFNLVTTIKPSVIAITEGDPYKEKKSSQAASIGASVIEIPKIHTPSTTQLAKLIGLET
ncbi:adenylyltransferase/cytidyltransferase family protein [Candidatus Gottesmanbacteria bacterium]|nr:adenylyltransferase/cytidyltransferase family protein [Candidatus Gottesmanbacteria bacterium]